VMTGNSPASVSSGIKRTYSRRDRTSPNSCRAGVRRFGSSESCPSSCHQMGHSLPT
jgi:hypothetical protein